MPNSHNERLRILKESKEIIIELITASPESRIDVETALTTIRKIGQISTRFAKNYIDDLKIDDELKFTNGYITLRKNTNSTIPADITAVLQAKREETA
jgi:hypothetical protein